MQIRRVLCLAACAAALTATADRPSAATGERHLLYAAVPGIRNYLEYGGIGVLVYDMDDGHRLLRRIPTFPLEGDVFPQKHKRLSANPPTRRL